MGDHRADIKIKMEFHGTVSECEMSINYFPTNCCNMDGAVMQFFEAAYHNGMREYEKQMAALYEQENAEAIKQKEVAELARLQAKYGALDDSALKKQGIDQVVMVDRNPQGEKK